MPKCIRHFGRALWSIDFCSSVISLPLKVTFLRLVNPLSGERASRYFKSNADMSKNISPSL